MKLDAIRADWTMFLNCKFNIIDLITENVDGFDGVRWVYPRESCELIAEDRVLGWLFSYAYCRRETEGFVMSQGFMMIAGSRNGSNLIMKVEGEHAGWCRWIAPGYETYEVSQFNKLTSKFLGSPMAVFEEMIAKGINYGWDSDFQWP